MQLSLIIPFYNEEKQIPQTLDVCIPILEGTGSSWEIIAIDDGSTDGSWQQLTTAAAADQRIRVFHFSVTLARKLLFVPVWIWPAEMRLS